MTQPRKNFLRTAEQIRPLATGRGACYASDRITVGGARVGYAYRDAPDNDTDSGWRFLAGDETQEYLDNPDNLAMYDCNTIANYDPAIIPLLNSPAGSAFVRGEKSGRLVPDEKE
ncbi:MAG: DUF2185 domain-containing protein [Phycisphaerales bacterium]|nr:DUF2185 domain-containing protein [Phycisphaerales bacterium]